MVMEAEIEDIAPTVPTRVLRRWQLLAAGVPLPLDVTNVGQLPHDPIIDGIAGTEVLDAGRSSQQPVRAGQRLVSCQCRREDLNLQGP